MNLEKHFENPYFPLYEKQKDIIKKALLAQFGLILGEQGVGKTIISVYIIKIWLSLGLIKNILIITKNEIKQKYKSELLNHIPGLGEKDIAVFSPEDRDFFGKKCKIYIADYNNIKMAYYHLDPKDKSKAKRIKDIFKLGSNWGVFLDEIQYVKSVKSDVHKIIFKNTSNVSSLIGLSGTPVEKIEELFAIFRVINPGIIGYNYHSFMNMIGELRPGTYQVLYYRQEGINRIWEKVNPCIFKIFKDDIKTMVVKRESDIIVNMDKDYEIEYLLYIKSIKASLKDPLFKNGRIVRRTLACIIPKMYDYIKQVDMVNPRFKRFHGFISRLVPTEKIIVWDNSPKVLNSLSSFYTNLGVGNLVIHGGIPIPERDSIIQEFNNNINVRLFFISVLSTKDAWEIPSREDVKRAIYYSFPISAINYSQSTDRIYRINSEKDVSIYRMYMKNTIDEWARDLLEYKLKLQKGILSVEDFERIEFESCKRFFSDSLI
jgi:SNF2 family DNA or RNA helicase